MNIYIHNNRNKFLHLNKKYFILENIKYNNYVYKNIRHYL